MPTYLTDIAICLRVTDFSETSQIVNLFTREHGLLGVIAKGSKRQDKKTVSGPLDLLTGGQVVFIAPKGSAELGTLAEWELTDQRTTLRRNLPALNAAYLAIETTTRLLQPMDPHGELFSELGATLDLLPTPERLRTIVAYLKTALSAAGYQPHLDGCVECGRPVLASSENGWRFNPQSGGVLCGHCADPATNHRTAGRSIPTSAALAYALHRLASPLQLQAAPPDRPADPTALLAALRLLIAQLELLTDRPLRTGSLPLE